MGKPILEGTNLYPKINVEKMDMKNQILSNFQLFVAVDGVDMTTSVLDIT